MKTHVNPDSYIELTRNLYGKEHRIVLYHSSSLERGKKEKFMKKMNKVIFKVKKIIDSDNYDSLERAMMYLDQRTSMRHYCCHRLK
jgi:hypothetical protein